MDTLLRSKDAMHRLELKNAIALLTADGYTVITPDDPAPDDTPQSDRSYSPAELAERWNCCLRTVYRMIRSGEVKVFRVGRNYRISETEVLRCERRIKE